MTRDDLVNELRARLLSSSNSNLFTNARLVEIVQSAYKRATSLFFWQPLARAKVTSTKALEVDQDICYYDYPDEFRTGSVFRVEIDNKEYDRKSFESLLDHRLKNPSSQSRYFSNYQRFIFITPNTSVGTNNMDIWGFIEAPELSSGSSETIFTGNLEEANYAVIDLGMSIALGRIDSDFAQKQEGKALVTLTKLNNDEWANYQRDQVLDNPMFKSFDMFTNGSSNNLIGKFNYVPGDQ